MIRSSELARTLVELADTLVADFDVVELLTLLTDRSVQLLEVDAAGLMLLAPEGELRVVASSSDEMRMLELFELQASEGPCLDAFRSGERIVNARLGDPQTRWPRFAPEAARAGFVSVHAVPMRLRGSVIGALNLFNNTPGELDEENIEAAQALADVATIAVLQHRAVFEAHLLNEQLNNALNSRIVIEQAKGVLGERTGLDMDRAFQLLRTFARSQNRRLADVAHDLISGALPAAALQAPAERPRIDRTR